MISETYYNSRRKELQRRLDELEAQQNDLYCDMEDHDLQGALEELYIEQEAIMIEMDDLDRNLFP